MPTTRPADEHGACSVVVYLDPSCPWSWTTARWLHEVAPPRGLRLSWRSLSLTLRDGDQVAAGAPPEIRRFALASGAQSHRLLRVFEALRSRDRDDAIDDLYTRWGERVFAAGPPVAPGPGLVGELLAEAGLPRWYADCADDPSWDAAITRSMSAAATATGGSLISPTITLDGQPDRPAFTGPLFTVAPTGTAALRAWDAVATLLAEPGFVELGRPRVGPPPAPPSAREDDAAVTGGAR